MAALPYIQLYVSDYLADTQHLTTEEHGAYMLLIFSYWQTGKPLKVSRLQTLARTFNERWPDVKETLSEFFTESNGEWIHSRIEEDLDKVKAKSIKNSEAGKASALARALKKQQESNDCSTNVVTNVPTKRQPKANHTDTDTDTDTDTIYIVESLQYLNDVTGRQFKKSSELSARLKEYSIDDIKLVIDYKAREWMGGDMQKYLRPQTLFNSNKFESYLNDAKQGIPHEKQQRTNKPNNKQQVEQYFSDPNNLRDF